MNRFERTMERYGGMVVLVGTPAIVVLLSVICTLAELRVEGRDDTKAIAVAVDQYFKYHGR